jgi:hypothetical protein
MTTHETDRPVDHDSVEDTNTDVADDAQEPVEDEQATTWSLQEDADDDDDTTDADWSTEPEAADVPGPADEPDRTVVATADPTPEPDPVQKLAPVDADTALDPGTGSYQDRWGAIQAGFIDDPRRTVESAGALMVEIWDETVRAITDEREGIDGRWRSAEASTDDLRAVMQDYRELYDRFMSFRSN